MSTEARSQAVPIPEQQTLILEVRLNGATSPLLWQFELLPDGTLATSAERLRMLGFDLALLGVSGEQPLVKLTDLPGVSYRYLDSTQSIEIDAADAALVPVVLDAGIAPQPIDPGKVEANLGLMVNYSLFADVSQSDATGTGQYEVRLLSPWGALTTNGFATVAAHKPSTTGHVRLDTYWQYIDARHAIAYAAGDVISEGGDLGSIYRLGGVQVRRDFDSRPDLVTTALPFLTGTAAVPSTIDLYINGMRYFTGETGRGPFQFRSLPNVGGGARATIVLTDATGRETRIVQPIFFAPSLLPRGMIDFSVEAGFPRLNHGTESFDYLGTPAGSGTIRYGVRNWLTLAAHAEGMEDFANGSLGGVVRIGGLGTISGSVAASWYQGVVDTRYQIDAEARVLGIDLYAGIERAEAGYQDVVRRTDVRARLGRANLPDQHVVVSPRTGAGDPVMLAYSSKTDRAGASFTVLDTGVNLTYTRIRLPQQHVRIAGASLYRTLFGEVSAWANGYKDFGDRRDYGIYVGISVPLGRGVSAQGSFEKTNRNTQVTARAWRDPDGTPGSWGWNLSATEPVDGDADPFRSATVRYHARFAMFEGSVMENRGEIRGTAYMEGSVVAMGGGVFFAPRIDDSFAVIAGAGEHTPVLSNTRLATYTDRSGRALVPYLASFQTNAVSIDPSELAVDLRPARTEAVVVPGDRAGVIIDFGVERIAAAIVILVDSAGAPLPVGSVVLLEGMAEPAVVGFDGRTYLTDLGAHNRIRVRREDGQECTAGFDFAPVAGTQIEIGPLTCQ
ncbi:MAG TPA: fimbria/pilus outer membrane usher protein [Croceibacterium sp.]|nr:fimbria/pilus outer membrane usher protein [Croceibacterium sp.]